MDEAILIGGGGEGYIQPQKLLLKYANRHGLVAGATGTGKTVTMQIMAEVLSAAGVSVFLSDVKGDVSGICQAGDPGGPNHAAFAKRAGMIGAPLDYRAFPVTFWDLFGEKGHPVRTTPTDMGPLLLSRLLELSDAQEGVMNIAFRLADEEGLALLDMKDLRAILTHLAENGGEISARYGLVTTSTVGAIQRKLLALENQGGNLLFGEPAMEISDLMLTTDQGEGRINILAADRLLNSPGLYATFLLWLLSELFEVLPEIGDPEKPRLVFFFDEAHLLFNDAPKALVDKVEQVVRLIRSKGVGIYFVTQNPADVPERILGQLGNRVQHALRAFTAKDQKELRLAAQNYRANPRFDLEEAIREVGTGEAVTSFLEVKGIPGMAERTLVRPPASRVGLPDDEVRESVFVASPLAGKYERSIDRQSAYEILDARKEKAAAEAERQDEDAGDIDENYNHARRYGAMGRVPATKRPAARRETVGDAFAKSLVRQLGRESGRAVVRGLMGTIFGKR